MSQIYIGVGRNCIPSRSPSYTPNPPAYNRPPAYTRLIVQTYDFSSNSIT